MLKDVVSIPRPFFLPGRAGRLFAVYHEPTGPAKTWGNILVVPAFNEEMNRCRSMVTIQAQALAKLGVGTMAIDLLGTGESDGVYGDARWDVWCDDVRQGIKWLDTQTGGCTALLGIRLGVPLALEVLRQDQNDRALIAWQPVVDGKTYLTQFMRTRIASNMDRTDIPKETTNGMRAQWAEGKSVEVTGYEIHPELAMSLESLRLATLAPPQSLPMAWFEKGSGEEIAISPGSNAVLDAWRLAGVVPEVGIFDGPAFWALYDRCFPPALVEMTSNYVQKLCVLK